MNIVTSTFNPPNQSGSIVVGRALPYVRSQSPVDSLEWEVASYIEGSSKDGHKEPWDSQPSTKQAKRSSNAERSARSQGHEDSFGLIGARNAHPFAQSKLRFLLLLPLISSRSRSFADVASFLPDSRLHRRGEQIFQSHAGLSGRRVSLVFRREKQIWTCSSSKQTLTLPISPLQRMEYIGRRLVMLPIGSYGVQYKLVAFLRRK